MYDIYEKWKYALLEVVLKSDNPNSGEKTIIGFIDEYQPDDQGIVLKPANKEYRESPDNTEKFGMNSWTFYPTYIDKKEIKAVLLLDENYEGE